MTPPAEAPPFQTIQTVQTVQTVFIPPPRWGGTRIQTIQTIQTVFPHTLAPMAIRAVSA